MLPVIASAGCGRPIDSIMTLRSQPVSAGAGAAAMASLGMARAACAVVAASPMRTAACRRICSSVSSCSSTPASQLSYRLASRPRSSARTITTGAPASTMETVQRVPRR